MYTSKSNQPDYKSRERITRKINATISDRKRLKNDGHLYFLVESVDVV